MNDVNNPFLIYAYAGPKYFCDRIEETEHLISALRNGRNVTLMSPRRMGKTGLIQNVFHQIRREYPEAACFYMDIFSTTCLDDFIIQFGQTVIGKLDNLSQKTLATISGFFRSCRLVFSPDVLTGVPQATLDFQPSQAQATLKEIFDYLEHSGKECYIAIDEFQQITGYVEKNVEATLRTYVQHCNNARFIFAGSQRHVMGNMFLTPSRPFYQSVSMMHLESIPLEEYIRFASMHFKRAGKEIEESAVTTVYQQFEGITWYIQKVLNTLYDMTPEYGVCKVGMVSGAIRQIIDSFRYTYSEILFRLPEKQKELLIAITKEGKAKAVTSGAFIRKYRLASASSVQAALKGLLEKDFVTQEMGICQIYDRFLGIWLKENY